jgi:prevent-host-death family protein
MNAVGIRALQQNAAAVVGRAHRGEVITITDRGCPVAELHPVAPSPLGRLLDTSALTKLVCQEAETEALRAWLFATPAA